MAELFSLVKYYNLPRYMVTWIPSIYPLYVSINIQAHHGSVMGSDDLWIYDLRKFPLRNFRTRKMMMSLIQVMISVV